MKKLTINIKILIGVIFCSAIITPGCTKQTPGPPELKQSDQGISILKMEGVTQISGAGSFATSNECDAASQGAAFAFKLTGDLTGCLYNFPDYFECSPSGTYRQDGREFFVGTYKGEPGTFWTTYKFEGRYEDCAENGTPLGPEIFGRCQHPLVEESGDGVFEGASGRLDFKDDVQTGTFYYRGHLGF